MKIKVKKKILSGNFTQADKNRKLFSRLGLKVINVMASPGAGKTSVIISILKSLPNNISAGVIEGDVASSIDTEKIKKAGWPAVQINTHGGCHLTASMITKALKKLLDIKAMGIIFIENIGNLICPSEFDLGESLRMVISSVPEGDDKPLKYPGIFMGADIIVLNKIDLLKHSDFSVKNFEAGIRVVNKKAKIFKVSCKSGEKVGEVAGYIFLSHKVP